MSSNKNKGTARETKAVRNAELWPGIQAQRAPNNAASRDVDVRVSGLGVFRVEVKDRQHLNAQKTLAAMKVANRGYPSALLWHRTSKPEGAKRSTPDGPTTYIVDESLFLRLLALAGLAASAVRWRHHPDMLAGLLDDADDVVVSLEADYPRMA